MNNQKYISKIMQSKELQDLPTKDTKHGNVFYNHNHQTLYSYGYHYPLATYFVNLGWIINTSGYSSSTARHIYKAKQACDYNFIGVPYSSNNSGAMTLENIHSSFLGAITEKIKEISNLKRAVSQKRDALNHQLTNLKKQYAKI